MKADIIIYHGNCADGFTAAWAVKRRFPEAELHAGVYQNAPPDVRGKRVVLVDFSYKFDVLREMALKANTILVLDHHKSADEDLTHERGIGDGPSVLRIDRREFVRPCWERVLDCSALDMVELGCSLIYAYFDQNRSGAGIAWDFFFPNEQRPPLIDRIEDRDLWRFRYDDTRDVQACVFSYPYDLAVWDALMKADLAQLANEGRAIERKHHKDVAELVGVCKRRIVIDGRSVWAASLPYTLTSDAGHLMCEGNEPFAACYWDTADGRVFSLRSRDDGADCSEIAKKYGGGGHAHAAGFRVPRDHELARE